MAIYLDDFCVLRPAYEVGQEEILEWLARAHSYAQKMPIEEKRERLFKLGTGKGKIEKRGSHLPDITHEEMGKRIIYNLETSPSGKGLKERSHFFEKSVNQIFEKFYPASAKLPPHLVHVTCTGYVSPSGAQHLVSQRDAGKHCSITHAYHMGCYAAIPAIRLGQGILHDKEQVDLVHTELCSLHMNPLLHQTDQLIVQTLFADGFIKYSLRRDHGSLKLLALHEEILPDTREEMSWRFEDWGMRMTLAKEVPVSISRALPSFLQTLLGQKPEAEILFAIHPGGPKIIEQIQKKLGLLDAQVEHSRKILENCGNMSSATLPHIWESMIRDSEVKAGTRIASLAFGPGLTMCGALFQKEKKA